MAGIEATGPELAKPRRPNRPRRGSRTAPDPSCPASRSPPWDPWPATGRHRPGGEERQGAKEEPAPWPRSPPRGSAPCPLGAASVALTPLGQLNTSPRWRRPPSPGSAKRQRGRVEILLQRQPAEHGAKGQPGGERYVALSAARLAPIPGAKTQQRHIGGAGQVPVPIPARTRASKGSRSCRAREKSRAPPRPPPGQAGSGCADPPRVLPGCPPRTRR